MPYDAKALAQRYLTALRANDDRERKRTVAIGKLNGSGCLVLMAYSLARLAGEHEQASFFSDVGGNDR